jgi:hypothetical protein
MNTLWLAPLALIVVLPCAAENLDGTTGADQHEAAKRSREMQSKKTNDAARNEGNPADGVHSNEKDREAHKSMQKQIREAVKEVNRKEASREKR